MYALKETWRRAHGCTSSLSMIIQVSSPMGSFIPTGASNIPIGNTTINNLNSNNHASLAGKTVQPLHMQSSGYSKNDIVIAVRPLGEISLSGIYIESTYDFLLSFFISPFQVVII